MMDVRSMTEVHMKAKPLQMPRWDRRLRIVLDWTVALFFRPDITRVDLRVEREQVRQARQLVERWSMQSGETSMP
jgi:hypothetical protein